MLNGANIDTLSVPSISKSNETADHDDQRKIKK